MVSLQIRDVPQEVRDVLADRARENGQSLQAFLLSLVVREASFAQNLAILEGLDDWTAGSGVTVESALAARDAARGREDTALREHEAGDNHPGRGSAA